MPRLLRDILCWLRKKSWVCSRNSVLDPLAASGVTSNTFTIFLIGDDCLEESEVKKNAMNKTEKNIKFASVLF